METTTVRTPNYTSVQITITKRRDVFSSGHNTPAGSKYPINIPQGMG